MNNILNFTDRETEILCLLAQGLTNKQIGERLYISAHTVKAHVASLLLKSNLTSRVELAVFAYKQGLIK